MAEQLYTCDSDYPTACVAVLPGSKPSGPTYSNFVCDFKCTTDGYAPYTGLAACIPPTKAQMNDACGAIPPGIFTSKSGPIEFTMWDEAPDSVYTQSADFNWITRYQQLANTIRTNAAGMMFNRLLLRIESPMPYKYNMPNPWSTDPSDPGYGTIYQLVKALMAPGANAKTPADFTLSTLPYTDKTSQWYGWSPTIVPPSIGPINPQYQIPCAVSAADQCQDQDCMSNCKFP